MTPHQTALVDQAAMEFNAEVNKLAAAMRLGIAEAGAQQTKLDFASYLVDKGHTRESLALLATTAICQRLQAEEAKQ
jgi:hypothetical protein